MTAPAILLPAKQRDMDARWFDWAGTVDHKRIGLLYIWTALFFFLVGGCEALLVRLQLAVPRAHLLSPEAYNQIFTMHGTTMIFLVVMPALAGFANYLVPLMIGAKDVAFPRLNAMAYWLLPLGGFLLHFSWLAGGAPNVGWFSYAPLSETPFTGADHGADYWAISLVVLGAGTVAGAINLIATILALRASGMTMRRVPLFVWMVFVNSLLTVLALPALTASCVLLLVDRLFSAHLFLPSAGGSALMWQHFFWSFGHPEVYIMVLPAFGMISEVVPVFSRKPIFGYAFVAGSTVAIAVLSFGVWAHHMFAVGLGRVADAIFAASSLLIAVPTGVKIFSWVATMWGGAIRLTTAMLFAVAFLVQFVVGGLSGVTFAVVPIDWQVTDTYYVVAHFHYVLFGGTAFGVMAAVYYWFPKSPAACSTRASDACTSGSWSSASISRFSCSTSSASWGCRGACTPIRTCRIGPRSTWSRRSARSFSAHRPSSSWSTCCARCASGRSRVTIRGTPGRSNGPPRRHRRSTISTPSRRSTVGARYGISRTRKRPMRTSDPTSPSTHRDPGPRKWPSCRSLPPKPRSSRCSSSRTSSTQRHLTVARRPTQASTAHGRAHSRSC